MLRLDHHNDGKEKQQSHEISIGEYRPFYNAEYDVFSHDPFDITGYGATKEEALEDFKRKFDYVMREWHTFEKMLFETSVVENDIIEVDNLGIAVN